MAKMSKKKQNELIEQEINRLLELIQELPEEKIQAAKRLIERAAFMKVTLEILEENIKTKGPTYLFVNGAQRMQVENPAQKSYNTMINRYTTACEKIFNLLPKEKVEVVDDDDFDNF
ncbi:hypothetical protein [Metabacillus niabensis]|uniref:P27 family phage terminase small subunit n=1 Tax=Metabacillus niabensis TaxID=324854 RepID=A0ABT9Z839_9BACI|nr:hypothetical protein [Metabacillus niabensis]MDQ0228421.1 hypothetical protein [Metabacillus niabensis]